MNVNQLVVKLTHLLNQSFSDITLCQQYAWWIIEAITQRDQAHLIAFWRNHAYARTGSIA